MRYNIVPILFMFMLALTGCVDEPLITSVDKDVDQIIANGPTLSFDVGLNGFDNGSGSRAIASGDPTYYEDWIDTQDKFRVLFFLDLSDAPEYASKLSGKYGKDIFLFESTSRWANQIGTDSQGNIQWHVVVPLYQIGEENIEYKDKWEEIRNLLRKYPFKVAILANHPLPKTKGGGPNWTVNDSFLNSDATKWKTINDIHHSVEDATYQSRSSNTDSNKDSYSHVMENRTYMGPFQDWVIQRAVKYGDGFGGSFNSRETARKWIRDRWHPALKYNEDNDPEIEYEPLYRNYRHLWYVWNFGGGATNNAYPYSKLSSVNENLDEWEERNGKNLREWIENAGNGNTLSSMSRTEGENTNYLNFTSSGATAYVETQSDGKKYYGVNMTANSKFTFNMHSHGTIFVTYIGTGSTSVNGKKSDGGTMSISEQGTSSEKDKYGNTITTDWYYIKVMEDPHDVNVQASSGTKILQIEFVRDEYLYLTDREAVIPSTEQPIPMFGMQSFDKLEGFWEEGSTFNLSDGGTGTKKYAGKKISLIRAVAKVEVLIPKTIGVPKHVYMRSLNRHVRCEPIDVQTPTDLLWKDHDNGCEWKDIQDFGAMYNRGDLTNANYRQIISWFWGSWLDWGWKFVGNHGTQRPNGSPNNRYPHLFNPYINRSDFASFADITDYYSDGYYHYVLYMGDNTIDAPTDHYKTSSRPMVPHVEIRFDRRYKGVSTVTTNTDINLEDNDCYRFYFTENGLACAYGTIGKTGYDQDYERNTTYTNKHWPIMRNHHYRFTIKGIETDGIGILPCDVEVRNSNIQYK